MPLMNMLKIKARLSFIVAKKNFRKAKLKVYKYPDFVNVEGIHLLYCFFLFPLYMYG